MGTREEEDKLTKLLGRVQVARANASLQQDNLRRQMEVARAAEEAAVKLETEFVTEYARIRREALGHA